MQLLADPLLQVSDPQARRLEEALSTAARSNTEEWKHRAHPHWLLGLSCPAEQPFWPKSEVVSNRILHEIFQTVSKKHTSAAAWAWEKRSWRVGEEGWRGRGRG